MSRQPSATAGRDDPVWIWPRAVLRGEVIACEKAKHEVNRFVSDWETMERGEGLYWFDAAAADDFCNFTRAVCKVHDTATDEMLPFVLMDWQLFRLRQIYGWKLKPGVADPLDRLPNTRRFRRWWISTGKGAGKGPMAAAIILYTLLRDPSANHTSGVVGGDTEPQAREVLADVRAMMDADKTGRLKQRLTLSSLEGAAIGYLRLKPGEGVVRTGYIKTTGTQGNAEKLSGPKHRLIVLDEYQAYYSKTGMSKLLAGQKKHAEPLALIMSNAPVRREGHVWQEYERVDKMLRGLVPWAADDDYLVSIHEVDEELGKQAQERDNSGGFTPAAKRLWPMSIPSVGTAATYAYVNQELRSAAGSEGDTDAPRRILGLVPHGSDTQGWIKWAEWERCLVKDRPEGITKRTPLYLSLDLGSVVAFTALGLCFRLPDGRLYVEQEAYTHEFELQERGEIAAAPFRKWRDEGWIKTNRGRKTDWQVVARRIRELADTYDVHGLAIDPWNARNFEVMMHDELGIPTRKGQAKEAKSGAGLLMVDHPQGGLVKKPPNLCQKTSMTAVQERVADTPPGILIQDNPLSNWQLACTTVTHVGAGSNLNRYLDVPKQDKKAGRKYNDSLIAMVMGVGLADFGKQMRKSNPNAVWDAMDAMAAIGRRGPRGVRDRR